MEEKKMNVSFFLRDVLSLTHSAGFPWKAVPTGVHWILPYM